MVLYNHKNECYGCGKCMAVCPHNAIVMDYDTEGFIYPVIDNDKCTQCGLCKVACEDMFKPEGSKGQAYAVRCNDEKLLYKSTSGGAFSLIAGEILSNGGLVCGALMDDELKVMHKISYDISGMRKAKYVESNITEVYEEIQKELVKGRTILFSGTPCQCQAVRGYFSEYENKIICVALICRGVQSVELWKEYIAYLGKYEKVTCYDFRDKSHCDNAHTVTYRLGNKKYCTAMNNDRFSRIYIKCLSLRPSCYKCGFCRKDLKFDFTIGDFWGIEKFHPEMADGKGTSLVIARGEKAERIVESIKDKAMVKNCNIDDVDQPALNVPAKESILRKFLFKDLASKNNEGHCDMELILKKYGV